MEKKFYLLRKTYFLLFLMCLVTSSAFAARKTFTITTKDAPTDMQTNVGANTGLKFSAFFNPANHAVLDYTKVSIVAHGTTTKVVDVVGATERNGVYTLEIAQNGYFTDKDYLSEKVDVVFADDAWHDGTDYSIAEIMEKVVTVWDAIDFKWGTTSFDVYEGNTTPYTLTFTVKGAESGVSYNAALAKDAKATLAGESATGNEYYDEDILSYSIQDFSGTTDIKSFNVAADEKLAQDNGTPYVLAVAYGTITVTYGKQTFNSPALSNGSVNVKALPHFAMKSADINFDKSHRSFTFIVGGGLTGGRSFESGKGLTYVGADDSAIKAKATGLEADKFNISVETKNENTNEVTVTLADGSNFTSGETVTVVIPAGAFQANDIKNADALNEFQATPLKAYYGTLSVEKTTTGYVSDQETTLIVNVPAYLEGTETQADVSLGTFKANITDANGNVETYTNATISDNVVSINLGTALTAGTYKLAFPASAFKACGDNSPVLPTTGAIEFTVAKGVVYPTTISNISKIDNKTTTLTFNLDITYNGETVNDYHFYTNPVKIDGETSNIESVSNNSTTGLVTVTLKNALDAKYHTITIPAGALNVGVVATANPEIKTNFEVVDYVDITVTPSIKDLTNITFTVTTKNSASNEVVESDLTNSVELITIGGITYAATQDETDNHIMKVAITENAVETYDGTVGRAISLKNIQNLIGKNNFTFSIDGKQLACEYTTKEAIENQVIPVTNFDPAPGQVVSYGYMIENYNVKLYDAAITVLDANKISMKYNDGTEDVDVPATYALGYEGMGVEITPTTLFTSDEAYTLTCEPGAIVATDGTVNLTNVSVTFDTTPLFVFDDATTKAKNIDSGRTLDKMTFQRNFKNTNYAALYVPFAIKAKDVAEYFDILKLSAVTEDDHVLTFHYNTLDNSEESTDTTYPNMPYIIQAKQAGEAKFNLSGVTLETPAATTPSHEKENANVWSATASDLYEFYGVIADDGVAGNGSFYAVTTSGSLYKVPTGYSVPTWRWYMTITAKDINYVKVFVDGNEISGDDATAIMSAVVNGENNNGIYTIGGQKVNAPVKGQVYIINGKKVVF